jgi:hypothetical protein
VTRLFLGRRGRGKTTLAYYEAAKVKRRIIFDPRGIIRRDGSAVCHTGQDFEQAIDALADGEVQEVVYAKPVESIKRIAFPLFTREVKALIVARPDLPIAVLVDELSFVCERSSLDEDLEWILKTSDPDVVQIFLTCHRPSDVPVDARAIADYWYIFQTTQEHDLSVIKERCKAETVALVGGLRDHDFVLWNDARGTVHEYRDPGEWLIALKDGRPIEWAELSKVG